MTESREETYRRLYASHFDAVLGYALRRTDRAEDAADVTADTFLVAWRRLAHVPSGPETRPWLYGVARRVLANHRRGDHRRTALGNRLRKELATSVPDTSDDVVQRTDVLAAMGRLSGRDQEVLQLHLWEGLRAARDRRGARPHHRRRPTSAVPRPGQVARAARQRSRATWTSSLQTTPADQEGAVMTAKLTDDAVAGLPLHLGRAELLEEIMSTPVLDDRPIRAEHPRRRTSWVVPVAAAAAVLALVAGSAWLVAGHGPGGDSGTEVAAAPAPGVYRAVLDAPGWTVDNVSVDRDSGELDYVKGDRSFEITWYPADDYAGYVEDRRHIVDPPADGEPIQVLGAGAQLWAYSANDHAAIREVDEDHWLELRGQGVDKATYLGLLTQLRLVDQDGFEAAMPGSFIDGSEREAAVGEILDGIGEVARPLLPSGVARSSITSDQNDPYQLGAEVAGAVACAWFDEYADATRAGADRRAQRAVGILTTARDWPVLKEIDAEGDYAEVLWSLADEVAAGQVPDWYVEGLGCEAGPAGASGSPSGAPD